MENINDNVQENLDDKKKKDKRSNIGFGVLTGVFALMILLSFCFSVFVLMKVEVIGPSMEKTLFDDDVVLASKMVCNVDPGDVIIIDLDEGEEEYLIIKRAIAVGKCKVEIKTDGYVYVDGEKIDEPYIDGAFTEASPYLGAGHGIWELEEGEIFYLGDNREVSADSRTNGPCTIDQVYGKVFNFSIKHKKTFTKIWG